MQSDFSRYISSALFTFVVGQGRKEFIVHSAPLAGLSTPLNNLINGRMSEAKNGKADWSEAVEEDTFIRLCEYAYVGDYTPPPCLEREASPSFPEPPAEPGDQFGFRSTFTQNKYKWKVAIEETPPPEEDAPYDPSEGRTLPYRDTNIRSRHLKDRFKDLNMRYADSYKNTLSLQTTKFAPTGNPDPQQSFAPVFLGHAKLYVVANTYDIPSLADLVLQKLAATLEHFTLCENNIGDIFGLVQFAYQHTLAGDGLRTLVTMYIASVLGQIGDSSTFRELLAEGGDFVYDFWNHIWC